MAKEGDNFKQTQPMRLTLVRGRHRWIFACDAGDRARLLRAVSRMAGEPGSGIEWFDAAIVTHMLGRNLETGLHKISMDEPLVSS